MPHVGRAPSGSGHGVQRVPHEAVSSSRRQLAPQRCAPVSQRKSQRPATQTALALAAVGHAALHAPQFKGSVAVSVHDAPQTRWPPSQLGVAASLVASIPPSTDASGAT
jgi:hypothetical protein